MANSKKLIGQTQELISSNSTLGLIGRIKEIHANEVWREERRANGKPFKTFSEYCTANQPHGLGVGQYNAWINAEALHGMLKGNKAIQDDLMEARVKTAKPLAKRGRPRGGKGSNTTFSLGRGSEYLLAKMKRAALDGNEDAKLALDRLSSGEITSVVKAAIASGVHKSVQSDKDRCPIQRIKMYWKRANAKERRELRAWLKTAEAKQAKRS